MAANPPPGPLGVGFGSAEFRVVVGSTAAGHCSKSALTMRLWVSIWVLGGVYSTLPVGEVKMMVPAVAARASRPHHTKRFSADGAFDWLKNTSGSSRLRE
jgi:hypothetical protein